MGAKDKRKWIKRNQATEIKGNPETELGRNKATGRKAVVTEAHQFNENGTK